MLFSSNKPNTLKRRIKIILIKDTVRENNATNSCTTLTAYTCPGVNLYVDGVQVFVGSPDVHIFYNGTDADTLKGPKKSKKNIFWMICI